MPSSHFPTTQHLLLLLSANFSLAAFTRPTPFRSHCLYERSPSSVRSRTWTPGPAHHFLAASVARLAMSVHTPSQLVSHLGQRFRITSPDSHQIPPLAHNPACGAVAADNTQTSHLQFPGAESSLHLTLLFTLWKQTPPP